MPTKYRPSARLTPPAPLPEFELPTMRGSTVSSADLQRGLAVLIFHRYAACPLCASKMAEYLVRGEEIRHVRHVPIFHSPLEKMQRFIPKWDDYPFEVLYDPDKEVYAAFGVGESTLGLVHPGYVREKIASKPFSEGRSPKDYDTTLKTLPGAFLVKDGTVVAVNYGRHWADIWGVDQLLAQLEQL